MPKVRRSGERQYAAHDRVNVASFEKVPSGERDGRLSFAS
jgi:hypothetical protein